MNKRAIGSVLILFLVVLTSSKVKFDFTLLAECPPNFILKNGNSCRIQSSYSDYPAGRQQWAGEIKRALPDARDGYTASQIDLGRYLFFDPVLSGSQKISCASCHQPDNGFSDGRERSLGTEDKQGRRGTPTLWNVAYLKLYFWDASIHTLEDQVRKSLFSDEMMHTDEEKLLTTLNSISEYRRLFNVAFPGKDDTGIKIEEVLTSLAAFQTSLVSLNSRYDNYVHGEIEALSPREVRGMNVFRSYVARCAECHTPPLFTNNQVAVTGVPSDDPGAGGVYKSERMNGAFRVPSLRNVARTAPYMHSGQYKSLEEAVRHYNSAGDTAGENPFLDDRVRNTKLSDEEIDLLVAFLKTLTDESGMPEIPEEVPSGREVGN